MGASKCCSDRVRDLLKEYRIEKNRQLPTGEGQKPPPTLEQISLENIEATEDEAKTMSDAQKEKALEETHLAKLLEDEALKSFAQKARHTTNNEDEWVENKQLKMQLLCFYL